MWGVLATLLVKCLRMAALPGSTCDHGSSVVSARLLAWSNKNIEEKQEKGREKRLVLLSLSCVFVACVALQHSDSHVISSWKDRNPLLQSPRRVLVAGQDAGSLIHRPCGPRPCRLGLCSWRRCISSDRHRLCWRKQSSRNVAAKGRDCHWRKQGMRFDSITSSLLHPWHATHHAEQ